MNPIILADNRFSDAVPAASGTAAGFDAANLADGRPYTFWQAPGAGTFYIIVACAAAASADCLGIIGHNLASAQALVSVERSMNGMEWIQVLAPFTPSSDKALMRRFVKGFGLFWRLKVTTSAAAASIAVAIIGNRIDFPFPPDSPYVPYVENVVEDSANSKSGNPLGTVVRYFPIEVTPVFSTIDRAWVEKVYRPFWENHGRYRKFFFWGWDLASYPDLVLYLQVVGKFETPLSLLRYCDSLKIQMQGVMEP